MSWSESESRAIALYAILDRDVEDFVEMTAQESVEVLSTLHLMLTTPQEKADANTKDLNRFGARLVFRAARDRKLAFPHLEGQLACDVCGATVGVEMESARTCYAVEPKPAFTRLGWDDPFEAPDPNSDIPLCRECAAQHHEWWDAQWEEFHASQG